MTIGFTSTSFRQIRDREKIVRIAKEAGVDCIEWGGDVHVKDVSDAKNTKELCDAYDIGISSYGSYYRIGSGNTEEWKKICEISAALGCGSVRVWLGEKGSRKTSEAEYETLVKDARAICATAKEYGLIVCPECHDGTFNDDTDSFLKIRQDIGEDNFRTYFQSRYKRLAYDLDRIERTLPFIESVHVSFSEQQREQFPKYDPSYIDKLLGKLVNCGFDGNLLIEYTYIFSWAGLPRCMVNDIQKIKGKIGKKI